MNTILLFGAGKSATVLIDYLSATVVEQNWKLIVADANLDQALAKTKNAPSTEAIAIDITDDNARAKLIQKAHVVISMMPPALHFLVARDCVEYRKHLLTASYIDSQVKSLQDEINHRKLLFLCEMGLDPGIDHMSAMKIIDGIRAKGGKVTSFRSHCGGLVAPESDDNPWHYKISWNPRNIVMAGSAGAEYKIDKEIINVKYADIYAGDATVNIDGLGALSFYPNRDSLSYVPLYKLPQADTFLRTTLRHPAFMKGWNMVVKAGLTDDKIQVYKEGLTFAEWSKPIQEFDSPENHELFKYLGFFSDEKVPAFTNTSADILQFLLETNLAMKAGDKDMIVMLHEISYELNQDTKIINSTLIVKGDDSLKTAMAKTVGLPLGIAAKLILLQELKLTGLHIPTRKQIYEPVLAELERMGIRFVEKETD